MTAILPRRGRASLLAVSSLVLLAAGCHRPAPRHRPASDHAPAAAKAPAGRTLDVVLTATGLGEIDPCG